MRKGEIGNEMVEQMRTRKMDQESDIGAMGSKQ